MWLINHKAEIYSNCVSYRDENNCRSPLCPVGGVCVSWITFDWLKKSQFDFKTVMVVDEDFHSAGILLSLGSVVDSGRRSFLCRWSTNKQLTRTGLSKLDQIFSAASGSQELTSGGCLSRLFSVHLQLPAAWTGRRFQATFSGNSSYSHKDFWMALW